MTEAEFVAIALSLPEAQLGVNHGRPALNVRGKIFAGPGEGRGGIAVVKLPLEQQEMLCEAEPSVFRPDPTGWGKLGWTSFNVEAADAATARSALIIAWRNMAPKTLVKKHPEL